MLTNEQDIRRAAIALHCEPKEIAAARRAEREALVATPAHSPEARARAETARARALPAETRASIVEAKRAGATYAELVARFGVSRSTITRIVHEAARQATVTPAGVSQ